MIICPSEDPRREHRFLTAKFKLLLARTSLDDARQLNNPEVYNQDTWFDMDAVFDCSIVPRYSQDVYINGDTIKRDED